ncbi:energy-coupling factor transporter transmembrane protein EcfT [Coriobacteriia bacterium Es71-Z0120]|uniref:energy-coupling factor transporter transmembrane component T n=1 Tax=Parvivirga hydrogeniphila TaxID=2939460 RepID=UPI002260D0B1|nr:energy-coupling factor transporter transmembrane component T [Parvivirga hydrogeniphila]MCL4079455.1 energy-coupling factor transporter transmembrane protein EcfT [Parvivirga hydrogeniphila]
MSADVTGGLPTFEPGALPHPIGLGAVPVGPRMFLAACGILAIALTPTILCLGVQLLALLAAATATGLLVPLVRSWRGVAWVSLSLLVIYSWAYPGSTDHVWIFGVQGFLAGLLIVIRLLGFVSVMYLLLLSTGPSAIIRWAGDVNEDLGIMISLTLSVLPVMKQQMDTTIQAQQARGMAMGGNLVRKMRAYLAVLIPVIVKSLVRAYGMAALLHVRGYSSSRRVKPQRKVTLGAAACYAAGALWIVAVAATRLVFR